MFLLLQIAYQPTKKGITECELLFQICKVYQ